MTDFASLAFALLSALLLASLTGAQPNTVAMEGAAVQVVEQYYGKYLTQCPALSSDYQFLTAYAACENDPAVQNSAKLFPSTCPSTCKQMSNIVGSACMEQYLTLLATKYTQIYLNFSNGDNLNPTSNNFFNGMISAYYINSTYTNSSVALAQEASQFADYYGAWADACGSVAPSSSNPPSAPTGSSSQVNVSGLLLVFGLAIYIAMLLA